MRIDYLKFSALGPYPGTHEVDFAALGQSALFLIDGPTGAGKTTVIDAIVFALYGQVSGEADAAVKMRSTHAKSTTHTEVELRFTVPSGTYVVRRSPEYMRAALRGGGETISRATCSVDRMLPGDEVNNIASQVRAANTELDRIVGLKHEQFRQTVVLPQGDFAAFLLANSAGRKPILQRIFATKRFEDVEQRLKVKARAATDAIAVLNRAVNEAIDTFVGRLSLDEDARTALHHAADPASGESLGGALDAIVAAAETARDEAKVAMVPLTAAYESATVALDARRAEAAALSAVATTQAAVTVATDRLATGVAAVSDQHGKAMRDVGLDSAAIGDVDKHADNSAKVANSIADLQVALAQERKLGDDRTLLVDKQGMLPDIDEAIAALGTEIDATLPQRIAEARAAWQGAVQAAAEVVQAQAEADAARSAVAAQAAVEQASKAVSAAGAKATTANDSSEKATAHALRLAEARLANAAAELAADLVHGEACAVCGSTDHPSPAQPADAMVTKDDVDAAQAIAAKAAQAARDAQKAAAKAQAELAAAEATLAAAGAAKDANIDALTAKLEDLKSRANQSEPLQARIAADEELLATKRELKDGKTNERAALVEQIAALEGSIAQATAAVQRAVHEFPTVEDRHRALIDLASALSDLGSLRDAVNAAAGAHTRAQGDLAALPQDDAFGQTAEAEARHTQANIALASAQQAHKTLLANAKDAATQRTEIKARAKARDDQSAGSRPLIRLARLASGDNELSMTLSTYVLTSLFGDVVEAANVRLTGMLEGRYTLVASETADDGRVRAGLDLLIHDGHAESERAVSSLSGGERFCVSLALALGLAEIVQANAGGIAIDTLFIDEGFGTLDGSRLNDVMNVLMGLKDHGRTVGLISHVESMKSQINEKITAVPNAEDGTSTLEVSWA